MVATTGSLASQPIAHLLAWIADVGFTGSLEIARSNGSDSAALSFHGGALTKIRTKQPIAYFGSLVYELGLIDAGALDTTWMELAKTRVPHGRIPRARGCITDAELA